MSSTSPKISWMEDNITSLTACSLLFFSVFKILSFSLKTVISLDTTVASQAYFGTDDVTVTSTYKIFLVRRYSCHSNICKMILVKIYYHGHNIWNNSDTACQQQNAKTSAIKYQMKVNNESKTYRNILNNNRSVQRILLISTKLKI